MPNEQWPTGEFGGQWMAPLANQADGSPPPADAPGWTMNVGNGGKYALGDYFPENETWTTRNAGVTIDYGPDSAWAAAQWAGDRFMEIGWFNHGPPMATAEPFPHERSFAYTQPPPGAGIGSCAFTTAGRCCLGTRTFTIASHRRRTSRTARSSSLDSSTRSTRASRR